MNFSIPISLNTSTWNLDWAGVTYLGAFGIGTIGTIDDSPGEIKGLGFELSGVPSANIALALDDAAVVQGTLVTIRTAILNAAFQVVDAPIEWEGRLDTMSIQEDGETCTISVTAESTAVDLLRGAPLTTSNADQQALYPGDRAFEYVVQQADKPVVWPSKDWFIFTAKR
ncbi:hypothetical protein [Variovorax saccharolyticus]|uniref:hypothetical protein n=1 Tax=Variovorax saccharolyticus TaxID=3053516 RepID=UPI002579164B|nr:hypothetical protein [Variovorax sp. J31P216]MDM0024071.1 hypothetical protein [Variovorax sp. J31P216]